MALLAFLLILGAATLAIVLYGFDRTQDHTTERSNEELRELRQLALQAVAGGVAEQGALLFDSVADLGKRGALHLELSNEPGTSPDTAEFATSAGGLFYDTRPSRISDLVVFNQHRPDEAAVRDDIAFSSALDAVLPILFRGFSGDAALPSLEPIAISFISASMYSSLRSAGLRN